MIALVAALVSLRRVQISPLGVSRRATPQPPTFWRLIVLALGVALYLYGLSATSHQSIGAATYPGLLLTMVGLVIAGPWFTWATARLFGSMSRGAAPLLASRRLADNPKAAFRSVTGLVLAVFLGTMVGTLVPAVNATEASPTNGALSNVLLDQVGMSGPAATAAARRAQRDRRGQRLPVLRGSLPAEDGGTAAGRRRQRRERRRVGSGNNRGGGGVSRPGKAWPAASRW